MFWKATMIRLVALLLCDFQTSAQGTFQNLNFEDSALPRRWQPDYYPASQVLPGWTLFRDHTAVTDSLIGVDAFPLGPGFIALVSSQNFPGRAEGLFSMALSNNQNPLTGAESPNGIGQIGEVPLGSKSLRFLNYFDVVPPVVEINGSVQPVYFDPEIPMRSAVDVSSFAGQTVDLRFYSRSRASTIIDTIAFSTLSVPEPSTWTLTIFGSITLLRKWGSKRP